MRAVLDACVLYPTVVRRLLLGVAGAQVFVPFWSDRLLREWQRTADRRGGAVERREADAEMARMVAMFPSGNVPADPTSEARLWLPDQGDIHVLATACLARADTIITFNLKDFPKRELYPFGISAAHPDAVLCATWQNAPTLIETLVERTHQEAEARAGQALSQKALLKRARLPRLAKAVAS